jgi:hypothetical protein
MSSDGKQTLSEKVRRHTQFIYERASGINLSIWSEMANDFLSAADRIEALEGEKQGWVEAEAQYLADVAVLVARAERLRAVLVTLSTDTNISQEERKFHARKALEDDKPIRAAAGGEGK